MPKKIDLTGQRFGNLVALYRNGTTKEGLVVWRCKCDCGKECDKVGVYLREGSTKSCGCMTGKYISESRRKTNQYNLSNQYGIGFDSKGNIFYFDLEDYELIKPYCWMKNSDGYFMAKKCDGTGKRYLMHNLIMGRKYVDHIGGCNTRNDNRKQNLRIFDNKHSFETYNNMNKKIQKNNKSGCVGVIWHKRDNIWESYITIDRKRVYLGRFENKSDAIQARKEAEEKYFGEYSYDNSQKIASNL
jgi:hypothetical protein